jgi:hypothetical protein
MLKHILLIAALLSITASPAFADFDAGKKAYDKKDWSTAIKELRPLAEAGDDRAMVVLGNMYNDGLGIIPSHKEAMALYKRAATEKNNTQGMDAVGAMYVSALGVDQNLQTALAWFHRSAMLGDQTGAFFYATIIFEGNKTPPNQVTPDLYHAYVWFKIAAAEKQNAKLQPIAAKFAKALAAKMLKADQVASADKEVAAWKPSDVKDLGPVPPDPPPAPAPVQGNVRNSSPPSKAPGTPLPHSEPLQK